MDAFVPLGPDVLRQSIPTRFAERARLQPEHLALSSRGARMTYGELAVASERVASALRATGVSRGDVVGIVAAHDAPAIIATLGVLRAGAIAAAVEATSPGVRVRGVIDDAGARVVLVDDAGLAKASLAAGDGRACLTVASILEAEPGPRLLPPEPRPDDVALLSYTSGSTGTPKGVMLTHAAVLRSVVAYATGYDLTPADRVSLFAFIGIGQGVSTAWTALLVGAGLCLWDPRTHGLAGVPEWLIGEGITVFVSAATILRQLSACPSLEAGHRIRLVKLGSETVRGRDLARARALFGRRPVFVNALSTTETLNICQHHVRPDVEIGDDEVVPIGRPVFGVDVLLVDEAGAPVADGAVGEIVARGAALSPGYWRRPEGTAAAFSVDADGQRRYRTGDLGCRRPDGIIEHRGRATFRVKVHGVRIELEAVEAALLGHPAVRQAAVDTRGAGEEMRLIGYVVPGSPPPSSRDLVDYLRARLPDAGVPTGWVFLDALPLSSNGKVDRQALASATGKRPALDAPFAPPETPVEELIAQIWSEVLRIDRVGRHDHFFELGGSSLAALRVGARLGERLAMGVPAELVFTEPVVSGLAVRLVEAMLTTPAGSDEASALAGE